MTGALLGIGIGAIVPIGAGELNGAGEAIGAGDDIGGGLGIVCATAIPPVTTASVRAVTDVLIRIFMMHPFYRPTVPSETRLPGRRPYRSIVN